MLEKNRLKLLFDDFEGKILGMTPGRTIYVINQSPALLKAWREMSQTQKRAILKACETAEEEDIERILLEIADGQRRLF